MLYKVVAEQGVVVNDVEFALGELFELEPDDFNVLELLALGEIEETEELLGDDVLEEVADEEISPRHEDEHRLGEEA